MPGVNIKKNDEVEVIAGKDRGKRGRVVNVLPKKNRIMIEGIARVTRHSKPSKRNQKGGLMVQEEFIDLSNVLVVCKTCGKATRVGHVEEGRTKSRVCRRCGAEL